MEDSKTIITQKFKELILETEKLGFTISGEMSNLSRVHLITNIYNIDNHEKIRELGVKFLKDLIELYPFNGDLSTEKGRIELNKYYSKVLD